MKVFAFNVGLSSLDAPKSASFTCTTRKDSPGIRAAPLVRVIVSVCVRESSLVRVILSVCERESSLVRVIVRVTLTFSECNEVWGTRTWRISL